jgi:hypothetical protein
MQAKWKLYNTYEKKELRICIYVQKKFLEQFISFLHIYTNVSALLFIYRLCKMYICFSYVKHI